MGYPRFMRLWIRLAGLLPDTLVYFAAERLIGFACAVHRPENMNGLTPAQCLNTWLDRKESK